MVCVCVGGTCGCVCCFFFLGVPIALSSFLVCRDTHFYPTAANTPHYSAFWSAVRVHVLAAPPPRPCPPPLSWARQASLAGWPARSPPLPLPGAHPEVRDPPLLAQQPFCSAPAGAPTPSPHCSCSAGTLEPQTARGSCQRAGPGAAGWGAAWDSAFLARPQHRCPLCGWPLEHPWESEAWAESPRGYFGMQSPGPLSPQSLHSRAQGRPRTLHLYPIARGAEQAQGWALGATV